MKTSQPKQLPSTGRRMIDRYLKGFLYGLAILGLAITPLAAEQIEVSYQFRQPEIVKVEVNGGTYDRVLMPGVDNIGEYGQPLLPADGAEIFIPPGHRVLDIKIDGEPLPLGDGFLVEPAGRPVKLSATEIKDSDLPRPDEKIYSSTALFPGENYESIGIQTFRGYDILILKLHPMQYRPRGGELYYIPDMKVTVTTQPTGDISPLLRGLAKDRARLEGKVDNPEAVEASANLTLGAKDITDPYDMLIITTSTLAPQFMPLKDFHDGARVATEIVTTDEIGGFGSTLIRDFIRDQYLNYGIEYVLIGGDDDVIPAINLYVESWSGPDAEVESRMPADIYFGCLDGTYNYDGDTNYGEPNDGEGGGDVDLVAEVYVGRASVNSAAEADNFVNKTLAYITTPGEYRSKTLLVGEYLGFGGVADYGGNALDELVDGSSAGGYATIGIPSDTFDIDRLYERDWAGHSWPRSEIVNRINAGVNILNHFGHGQTTNAMKLSTSDIYTSITSTEYCFIYSQTCLAGHFDGMDCWSEYMTVKTDHGAFAAVMNARYGWGSSNTTDGPSHRFNRQFWDAVYNPAENKRPLGPANHDSKEDNLYRINNSCMRWCYYELNLFGDPAVAIDVDPYLGITVAADTTFGPSPLDVNFTGESDLIVDTWTWDFGDGDSSYLQSPSHTYSEPGLYDISLCVDAEGEIITLNRTHYIAITADSLMADEVDGSMGSSLAITIFALNHLPLEQLIVPIEYGGPLELDFDSFSTAGCRSDVMTATMTQLDFYNKRLAFKLEGNLEGGSGNILKVYFTISGGSPLATNPIILDGFNQFQPEFHYGSRTYRPDQTTGAITLNFICGDVNDDGLVNILDITALITYKYKDGPEPTIPEAADINDDGLINILDIIGLINYKYKDGPPPEC